jgi:dicarboxylate transporter 10
MSASSSKSDLGAVALKPRPYPFWLGGVAASIAACFTHPLDVAKTRLQTAKARQGLVGTLVGAARADGIAGVYTGLTASLLRQMTYSVVRFGVYDHLKGQLKPEKGRKTLSPWAVAGAASIAGAAGGIAGNPADIILVRMTSDINKKAADRYNYPDAVRGVFRMVQNEGLASLFRGVAPNTVRAVLMNASQLATYDVAKDAILHTGYMKEGTLLHFSASFVAGTVATTVCSPADVIKARIMSTSKDAGSPRNAVQNLQRAIQREGVGFLFRGWTPAWIRLAPNTILIFLTLEKLRLLVDKTRESRGIPTKRSIAASSQ